MNAPTARYQTAGEMWAGRVAEGKDGLAFRHRKDGAWVDLSWRQSDEIAREIGAGLISLGLETGDRVCLLSQTRLEWLLCDLGTLLAGGAAVPIYPSSTADQCAYIVRDAGARAIVVEDAAQLEKILPLLSGDFRAIYIQGDCTLDKADARGRTRVTLAEVLASAPPAPPPPCSASKTCGRKAARSWRRSRPRWTLA